MAATPGTIPALTPYQPDALPLAGTEAFEIVNTTNATAAASFYLLLTDAVGKAPSVLPSVNPSTLDSIAIYQASSGLPRATLIGNLSVPAGNVAVGGIAGQVYTKNSGTNFDASWTTAVPFLTLGTAAISGIATTGGLAVKTAATIANLQLSTGTATNLFVTNGTVTNLSALGGTANLTTATVANLSVAALTVTNITATNATVLNMVVTGNATVNGKIVAISTGNLLGSSSAFGGDTNVLVLACASSSVQGLVARSTDGNFANLLPSISGGSFNGLAQSRDAAIIFAKTGVQDGGGGFVIGPWATTNDGMRIGHGVAVGTSTDPGTGNFLVSGAGAFGGGGVTAIVLDGSTSIIQAVTNGPWCLTGFVVGSAAGVGGFGFAKTRGLNSSTQSAVQAGDSAGGFQTYWSDGSQYVPTAGMDFTVSTTVSSNSVPTEWSVRTGNTNYGNVNLMVSSAGNVVVNAAAISTAAADGFLYLETCNGTPTGTPTSYSGRAPLVFDTANSKLWFYNSGWKSATFA